MAVAVVLDCVVVMVKLLPKLPEVLALLLRVEEHKMVACLLAGPSMASIPVVAVVAVISVMAPWTTCKMVGLVLVMVVLGACVLVAVVLVEVFLVLLVVVVVVVVLAKVNI